MLNTLLSTCPYGQAAKLHYHIYIMESYTMSQTKKVQARSNISNNNEVEKLAKQGVHQYPLPHTPFHLIAHATMYRGKIHHIFHPTWCLHSQPHKFEVG